ncbi:MAG: hypothetical protein BMS9Abin37_1773 [Acidobacteriota bacterium]|nr:MAG: hypothetical protein BMS9Abin37_1773 [Acidobacteriota bacterium]
MDCLACGRNNAADRMECEFCSALLVDAFAQADDMTTDPIEMIGGSRTTSVDTDALLRAAREMPEDDYFEPRGSLHRFSKPPQYTGELPRLFRFGNRYQILEKLGEGGMGRVYKALDLELDRAVALKTIRGEKSSSSEVRERFKQELILARKITHKNVIRIYDLGEFEGMKFFTMELVEGASLREVLNEKQKLSVAETLSLMKQMLAGLAEAHSQDVVHRDLKPQNIMVDGRGVIRIMDFGIARTADSATMTGTGEMMGTPDYISPEQVKGETANAQSDIYSFGIILYELLTGETPFKGDTPISKIVARIQAKAPSPSVLNPDIPAYLERIVLKCLEADPDLRYKSAEEVLEDLTREQVDSSLWLRTKKAVSRRPGWIASACLAGALGVGAWHNMTQPPPTAAADVPTTTLAVLPFHNVTGAEELAWMEIGIPEMLITDISQSPTLRPVTAAHMNQILQDLGKEGRSRFDEQTLGVVSEMADAQVSLHGRFVEAQGQLRMDLVLRDSRTGVSTPIQIEGPATEVFGLVDAITVEVAKELDLEAGVDRPIHEVSTASLRAFRAYHRGLEALHRGANQAAIPLFQEAIAEDSDFAMAHAHLAEAFFHLGNESGAREAVAEAERLAQIVQLPRGERYEVHAIAARIDDDPETAVESYRELQKLYPNDPGVLHSLASSLETMGQVEEAVVTYRGVLARDPQYGGALLGLGRMLVTNRRPREAIPILQRAVDAGEFEGDLETLGMIHSILGVAHRDLQELDLATEELQKSLACRRAAQDSRGVAATLTNLARVYAALGQFQQARDLLNEGLSIARESGNSTMESYALLNLGAVHELSGDLRKALSNYSDSLEIEWERKEHTELIYRLNFIGHMYALLGKYADAMVYLEQAKVHIAASNDVKGRAYNLYYVGKIHRVKGNYKEAIGAFLGAIPLFQTTGNLDEVAAVHDSLADLYIDQNRLEEAKASVEASLALSEERRTPSRIAHSRILEARLALAEKRFDDAIRNLDEAERSIQGIDARGVLPLLQLVRGTLKREQQDIQGALRSLMLAKQLSRQSGHAALELEATIELARAQLDDKEPQLADELLAEVIRTTERSRLRPLLSEALVTRSRVSFALGEPQRALQEIEEAIGLATEFDGRRFMKEAVRFRRFINSANASGTRR